MIIHIIIAILATVIVASFTYMSGHWDDQTVISLVTQAKDFIENHNVIFVMCATFVAIILFESMMRILKHYKRGTIALSSGLFFYSTNKTRLQRRKSKKFLKEQSKNKSNLYIIGSTGWHTFGHPKSPLHDAFISCREAKIMLACPFSDCTKKRAENLNIDFTLYKKELIDGVKHLKKHSGNCRIEIKFYRTYPFWKYIILQDQVWVQQYPKDVRVHLSPGYAFQKLERPEDQSIFIHVYNQFLRMWDNENLGIYDLVTDKITYKDGSIYELDL